MNKKEIKMNKKYIYLQRIIILVAIISLGYIYMTHQIYPEKKVDPIIEEKVDESGVVVSNPIDFDGYWEINKDVYAYIYIDGTNIDYPILQHESDDSYYLNYTIDNKKGYPGSIYTEKANSREFSDPNTVIYGHNMKNGTMFHEILSYKDPDYFNQHLYIYIYTPTKILQYTVFAAYTYDDRHLLSSFDFKNQDVFQNYLEEILENSKANLNKDVVVNKDNQIITLSSCSSSSETRTIVQAVLTKTIECKYKSEVSLSSNESTPVGMKTVDKE